MSNENVQLNIVRTVVEPGKIKLDIEMPVQLVDSTYETAVEAYTSQAPISGFRAGKAPKKLLLRKYKKDIIERTKGELLEKGCKQALAQEELTPETRVKVENEEEVTVQAGQPFVFGITFEVAPEFDLPEYKGIQVVREDSKVEDSEIDEFIDGWLQQQSQYVAVDRPAEDGDLLKLSYKGEVAGDVEIPDTAKFYLDATDTWLPMREPSLIPGVKDALIGISAGESREVETTFPEDHGAAALNGVTVKYKFDVSEVQAMEKPELNEEILERTGMKDEAELRERVRGNMFMQKLQEQDRAIRDQVVQAITAGLDLVLPPTFLNGTIANAMQRLRQEEMQAGSSPEDLAAKEEELVQKATARARDELTRYYVLDKIGNAENITATPEDLNEAVEMMAQYQKCTTKVAIRKLREENRIGDMLMSIRERKIIDFLLDAATIVDSDGNVIEKESPAEAAPAEESPAEETSSEE